MARGLIKFLCFSLSLRRILSNCCKGTFVEVEALIREDDEQVTFVPEETPPPSFKYTLELGGMSIMLYTYSFLNFGQVSFLNFLVGFIQEECSM